jgi:hypothetical protein
VSCRLPVQTAPSGHAEVSRGSSPLSRLRSTLASRVLGASIILAGLGWLFSEGPRIAAGADASGGLRIEVVVTGIPRPIQLGFDGQGALVVLSQGWRGDAAGEIYRIDLRGAQSLDATRMPRVVIPFAGEPRKTALGSLAVDSKNGDLFLGEENGNRIYRLGASHRLQAVAVGLDHLLGGSTIALDARGRLVFLDYASPETHLRSETPLAPSLSWLTEEGYRGPVVFRADLYDDRPLPRRADVLVPILPQIGRPVTSREPPGRDPMWRLIGVTSAGDGLIVLSAVGEVSTLGSDGDLRFIARLPVGHYHRTSLAVGPEGSVFVSGGFQIQKIYRVSPAGEVSTVASELGDPGGIVFDRSGALYVAETALHRIIRITGLR